MPDTADHRADMFALTQERRRAGLPAWDRTLRLADVFHNETMTFEGRRDAIVSRIRESAWFTTGHDPGDDELQQLVEELADAEDKHSFNAVWDEIYDIADADRVWIETC